MNLTERIESVILSNLKIPNERKIGIEYECIFYNSKGSRIPVNPSDEISAKDILQELDDLQKEDRIKSGYTLEPGGQIEWASPPLTTLHEIDIYQNIHKERMKGIAIRERLSKLEYSVEPTYAPTEIELINNEKYRLMDKMFTKTGSLGQWMMRNTTSVQINIDYSSREAAEKMAFVVDCLTPIASILFANSPYWGGQPTGNANLRYKIWGATDNSRCGDLLDHGITSAENLIHRYAQYVQTVPAIFILNSDQQVVEFNGLLGDWLQRLAKEGRLSDNDIQTALHQIFTHMRFKDVIEIRSCDKPPNGFEMAPVAFWTGLLLDEATLNEIYKTVKKWTLSEREKLKQAAANLNLDQSAPRNRSIKEWIKGISNTSIKGLINRAKTLAIEEETHFLTGYIDLVNENGIPALTAQG